MRLQDLITSNTAADQRMLRKLIFFIHSLDVCSLWILNHPLEGSQTEPGQHSAAPSQVSKGKTRRLLTNSE